MGAWNADFFALSPASSGSRRSALRRIAFFVGCSLSAGVCSVTVRLVRMFASSVPPTAETLISPDASAAATSASHSSAERKSSTVITGGSMESTRRPGTSVLTRRKSWPVRSPKPPFGRGRLDRNDTGQHRSIDRRKGQGESIDHVTPFTVARRTRGVRRHVGDGRE